MIHQKYNLFGLVHKHFWNFDSVRVQFVFQYRLKKDGRHKHPPATQAKNAPTTYCSIQNGDTFALKMTIIINWCVKYAL